MSVIQSEQATVYCGGGRHWFTKRGAANAQAKSKIKTRCECEVNYHEGYGVEHILCSYHVDRERFKKIVRRLARIYLKAA